MTLTCIIIYFIFGFGFARSRRLLVSYRTLASAASSFLDFLAGVQLLRVSTRRQSSASNPVVVPLCVIVVRG